MEFGSTIQSYNSRRNPISAFEKYHHRTVVGNTFFCKSLVAFVGVLLFIIAGLPLVITGRISFGEARNDCYARRELLNERADFERDVTESASNNIYPVQ